ncbi:hypothetical protein BDZ94DRAFT_1266287 [Collybia nuda]|uniref:Uncharacterized protein n=1 Tax=Collybia nuda TaxID=64659 RepID=A0A9P5Y141_9AGAR|nr:hypothetical protein BDZ94DRAFT_1266287 [Collybia nuda]
MPQTLDDLGAQNKPTPVDIERIRKREGLSVLQERTNSVTVDLNPPSTVHEQRTVTILYTPGTSFKLGVPLIATPRSSSVSLAIREPEAKERCVTPGPGDAKDVRRLKRYSAAEEKLAKTFRNCNTELSPQELKIRALEKATSILNSHAHDARDRAQELQVILADREMDRVVFETLKRERWMEEKRQLAVEQERKVVSEQLDTLTKSLHDDGSHASHTQAHAPTAQVRKHVNLIKFLETSQTHKPIHPHTPITLYAERSLRRRTMDKVSPMRLRTSSTIHSSAEFPKHHLRSISLDGHISSHPISIPQAKSLLKSNIPTHRVPLGVVTEGVVLDSPHTCTTTALSDHSTSFDELPSTPLTTATSTLPDPTLPTDLNCERETNLDSRNGTAIIFCPTPQITSEDLIDNIHVSLPDYAVDLFTRFEADMEPLQPISYPLDPQPNPHASDKTFPSRRPESSFLQVPSPTKQKDPFIKRPGSHRNLRSLISIPEALSSRLRVEKQNLNPGGGQGNQVTPRSSVSSLVVGDTHGGIGAKVKKRFSALRLH